MSRPRPLIAALKIWFAGVVFGPVLLALGAMVGSLSTGGANDNLGDPGSLLMLWSLMILYGAVFSLPSALLLWLALAIQYRFQQTGPAFFSMLFFVTFLLAAGPFFVFRGFSGDKDTFFYGLMAAYVGAIWAGVLWAFRRVKTGLIEAADEPLDAEL